jgi:four helix bundle protein
MLERERPMPSRPEDLRARTFRFACAIVSFCQSVTEHSWLTRHVAYQLLKSGTSVGANVEEAKAAYSRREFVAKTAIALKEARETLYWLRLISACQLVTVQRTKPLASEADELVAILTASVKTARSLKATPGYGSTGGS